LYPDFKVGGGVKDCSTKQGSVCEILQIIMGFQLGVNRIKGCLERELPPGRETLEPSGDSLLASPFSPLPPVESRGSRPLGLVSNLGDELDPKVSTKGRVPSSRRREAIGVASANILKGISVLFILVI
jgi:hypothetical protein